MREEKNEGQTTEWKMGPLAELGDPIHQSLQA